MIRTRDLFLFVVSLVILFLAIAVTLRTDSSRQSAELSIVSTAPEVPDASAPETEGVE